MGIRMELAVAFLAGAAAKIYDDIVDTNIEVSGTLKESLKGFQWMALAVLSVNDFNFAATIYGINLVFSIVDNDAFKGDYESSLLRVFPLIFLINYDKVESLFLIHVLVVALSVIFGAFELLITTKNVSFKKFISRTISIVIHFITISLHNYFNIPQSAVKVLVFFFGYVLISSLFQAYMLYIHEEHEVPKEAHKEAPKEVPKEAPKEVPKEAPKDTIDATTLPKGPIDIAKEAPKEPLKDV